MNEFLISRIIRPARGPWAQALLGLFCAAIAIGIRWALTPVIGGGTPFVAFVPAVLVAGVFGGRVAGLVCVAVASLAGAFLFLAPQADHVTQRRVAGEATFLLSSMFMLWITGLLRTAMRRVVEAQETERLLSAELRHRVKNTLAVVQGLAAQTFPTGPEAATGPERDFTERLIALGEAHNLLSDAAWGEVTLDAAAERVLRPFHALGVDRIRMDGEAIPLPSNHVVSLVLCLHELATNAMKYGALSREGGHVTLAWERIGAAGRRVRIVWREHGGPAVVAPSRRGFGHRLLERGLDRGRRPGGALAFPSDGVCWTGEIGLDAR